MSLVKTDTFVVIINLELEEPPSPFAVAICDNLLDKLAFTAGVKPSICAGIYGVKAIRAPSSDFPAVFCAKAVNDTPSTQIAKNIFFISS